MTRLPSHSRGHRAAGLVAGCPWLPFWLYGGPPGLWDPNYFLDKFYFFRRLLLLSEFCAARLLSAERKCYFSSDAKLQRLL